MVQLGTPPEEVLNRPHPAGGEEGPVARQPPAPGSLGGPVGSWGEGGLLKDMAPTSSHSLEPLPRLQRHSPATEDKLPLALLGHCFVFF